MENKQSTGLNFRQQMFASYKKLSATPFFKVHLQTQLDVYTDSIDDDDDDDDDDGYININNI